jgi:hypothetical protein
MNDFTSSTSTVSGPKQAISEFVGEQFIEWLMTYISHAMQSWPQIIAIREASPKPEKIKKFMLQRFLAAEAFLGRAEGDPGFLRFALANLSESNDPTAESALEVLEKKRSDEMMGHKIENGIIHTTHRELWLRLLTGLGLTIEEIDRAEAKEGTRNYIAELSDVYSASEWQTAVGAFAAHERAVPEEYKAIVAMLKSNTNLTEKDLETLTNHIGADTKYVVNTNHILDKIVFDPETKQLVWDGVSRQLEIRQEFLSSLMKYLES